MEQKNKIPVIAIFLTVALFTLQHFSTQPPSPKGLETPENEFSAVRAHNILKSLLRENKPHPVGSDLNKIIKERLKKELDKLGISTTAIVLSDAEAAYRLLCPSGNGVLLSIGTGIICIAKDKNKIYATH